MKRTKIALILSFILLTEIVYAQDTISKENIPTLNRIAGEYDFWKFIFGITAVVLAIWSFFGLKFFVKTKAHEWILEKIAKESELKIENLKAAIREYAQITDLKKKRILVLSSEEGQQANVKKIFDHCGFAYDENTWIEVQKLDSLKLGNVDVLLFNDQINLPLTEDQIESAIIKFKANVGYFYFGDKRIKSDEYRKKYNIDIDFCNSDTRLETGLLSLLKLR